MLLRSHVPERTKLLVGLRPLSVLLLLLGSLGSLHGISAGGSVAVHLLLVHHFDGFGGGLTLGLFSPAVPRVLLLLSRHLVVLAARHLLLLLDLSLPVLLSRSHGHGRQVDACRGLIRSLILVVAVHLDGVRR